MRTIASAWEQADEPARVSFAILQQFGEETAGQLAPLTGDPRVRSLSIEWTSGRGLGWARRLTDRMWNGEEFTLQIDSHTRFARGWDAALVEQWRAAEDPRAVLSCLPGPYQNTSPSLVTLRQATPHLLVPAGTDEHGLPRQDVGPSVSGGTPALLVAGGFQFSAGALCRELEQLRDVMIADEYVQALRLYTHGWNVYAPWTVPLFHLYERDKEAHSLSWDTAFSATPELARTRARLRARSIETARAVMTGSGAGALGNVRSRDDFTARLRALPRASTGEQAR